MIVLAPLGAQGQGPKGPKVGNFQTSSSLDPETVELSHFVCRYLYMWLVIIVHDKAQGGPVWALRGRQVGGRALMGIFHIFFTEHQWI